MYYAKVNWFDSYDDSDKIDHIFILAHDWNEAMQKVTNEFEQVNSIEMREVVYGPSAMIYVPEEIVETIISTNTY